MPPTPPAAKSRKLWRDFLVAFWTSSLSSAVEGSFSTTASVGEDMVSVCVGVVGPASGLGLDVVVVVVVVVVVGIVSQLPEV